MIDEKARALGNDLAQRRKAAGVTLEDMARDTKIRRPILEAIEGGNFESLPADVFVVGFIKAYCLRLEVDPAPFIGRFMNRNNADPEETEDAPGEEPKGRGRGVWMLWALILVVAAAIAAGLLWRAGLLSLGPVEPIKPPPPPRETGPSLPHPPENALNAPEQPSADSGNRGQNAPAPSAEPSASPSVEPAGGAPSARAPEQKPEGDLVIHCTQPCWLALWADGEREVFRLLSPGETLAFDGTRFRADIGNAAGLSITYRGRSVKLPAVENKVIKDFVIPRPAEAEKAP